MLKIAFIGLKGIPARAGADRVVELLSTRLAGRYELSLYCSRLHTPPGASLPGVRLVRLPSLPGKYASTASMDFLAAWHALFWGDYHLIHLHNIEAGFVLPILRLKYPVIATAHGRVPLSGSVSPLPAFLMRCMELPFAYLSSCRTSVSRQHAEQLELHYHRPVVYIPNPIDPRPEVDLETARQILSREGQAATGYLLFAAGRILQIKGVHVLLEALRQYPGAGRLLIVGSQVRDPAYVSSLRQLAGKEVVFLPMLERPVLLGLMKLCRLFIFPSLQEAMSVTLLEAASQAVPIICSDIPANRAVLSEQALYFASGEAPDLALKLRWALDHPQEMALMGSRAQVWVGGQFALDTIVEQYARLYDQVAKR